MVSGYKHGDTPKRAMVRGTISYLESQGLPVNKSAIFRHFELSRSQGYAALSIPASKRNNPEWEETRGRPNKISEADQHKMEQILWDERYEEVNLNWNGLAKEAGLETDCNARTLHRTMGTLGYRRCLGCSRSWVHKKTREKRVEYAERMLEVYPQPHNWRFIRFSGELHFGFGLDGKMRLLPRPGEKYCEGCKDQPPADWGRDIRRVHCWAAIGYGFKSELVFYDDQTNPNHTGVMSMADYTGKVLDRVVKPWLDLSGTNQFILEEDIEAFAHGGASKSNMAQEWKAAHELKCYFNCLDSPDLNPLDTQWPPHKQWTVEPLTDWSDAKLRQAARDAWASLDQERVNMWVDFMPQRLRQVIDSQGRMVPW
ncbi:uncharacterized protein F5Z01DRAFT_670196 [Emericellopsis atlantica]|uniref:Uncharacterized protein n=1 Tax=Emericellopsis atlantica TaxID=2614577 RepID=A0A9P8CTQ8_9HYPO|nr:uncharacterized protein F5Z01DRAFT_670196 [Emericellopsis atlantica]KAG9258480.1 hypothetical protein F5Z01DRAFT_670196 [Emericellopsis atlantica]